MSGSTTELALKTAVDSDDTADYLTLSLADSLRTLDALFSNISGHTHAGSHQGGPIGSVPASSIPPASVGSTELKPPIDINDWFRTTGHPTAVPTTGTGLELFYDAPSTSALVQSYDRGSNVYRTLSLAGSSILLRGNGGNGLTVLSTGEVSVLANTGHGVLQAAGGHLYLRTGVAGGAVIMDTGSGGLQVTSGPLLVSGAATVGSLTVSGSLAVAGTTTLAASTLNGQFNLNGQLVHVGNSTITGNLAVTGSVTFGSNPGTGQVLGLPNSTGIAWRDAAGSNNIVMGFSNANVWVMGIAGGTPPATSNAASAGGVAKPATYAGFLHMSYMGTTYKVPFYNN